MRYVTRGHNTVGYYPKTPHNTKTYLFHGLSIVIRVSNPLTCRQESKLGPFPIHRCLRSPAGALACPLKQPLVPVMQGMDSGRVEPFPTWPKPSGHLQCHCTNVFLFIQPSLEGNRETGCPAERRIPLWNGRGDQGSSLWGVGVGESWGEAESLLLPGVDWHGASCTYKVGSWGAGERLDFLFPYTVLLHLVTEMLNVGFQEN